MAKQSRKKPKFYIAHSVINREYIRDTVCPALQAAGITTVNPLYEDDGTARKNRGEIAALDRGELKPYFKMNKTDAFRIVAGDLAFIDKSDGIIAIVDDPSIGTSMEIFYGSFCREKPVYVITKKYKNHVWLRRFATRIFDSLESLIEYFSK